MSLLKLFLEEPEEFARQNSLSIPGPGVSIQFKDKPLEEDENEASALQVGSADRIIWFDIDRTKGDRSNVEVQLQRDYEEGLVPAYWLPWEENKIIRTALRPSKKAKGTLKDVDPDFFFTAPLNGCSIFVEGTLQQPTVYHANARAHAGSFTTDLTKQQFKKLQQDKIEEMQRKYAAMVQAHPKESRDGSKSLYTKQAAMTDYLSRGHSPLFPSDLEEVVRAATGGKVSKIEIAGKKIVVSNAEGTVFGVRRKGDWAFYYQKRVRYEYLVNDYEVNRAQRNILGKGLTWLSPSDWAEWSNSSWRVETASWLPLQFEEFWPNGKGRVVV